VERLEAVKKALDVIKIKYYSPKDESLYVPGKTTPKEILDANIQALQSCDLLVCITDDRDPGTFFEAGWCFASSIPIVYIWFSGEKGQKFNLMLGASGSVVRDTNTLMQVIERAAISGYIEDITYGDAIEYE
jgi:nucleoside 2-deoxyribosyltransferase